MGRLPLLSTMKDNKNSNLLPEYVWMIFVGMLLAILVLMHVFPAKAWTGSEDFVILYDYVNMRYIRGTSDHDANVYHPGVSQFYISDVSYNGSSWVSSPEYVPNTFGTNSLSSCILAPSSSWADENLSTYHRIAAGASVQTIAIPTVSDSRVSGFGSGVYFEGGDGFIYAVFSDSTIYLKNKDQRGVSGVYYVLPYFDSSGVYVYKWSGAWNYLGVSTFFDTSITDSIAVSTLLSGGFTWGDFVYNWDRLLSTDNFGLYNGTLPRLDVYSSLFDDSFDIPVDPEPEPMEDYYVLVPSLYSGSFDPNYMFTIKASGLNGVFVQSQDSTWISLKSSYPDLSTDLKFNAAVLKLDAYTGSWLGSYYGKTGIFYFQVSSYSDIKLYTRNNSIVTDPDVMKQVGSVSDGVINDSNSYEYPSYFVQELEDGGYCIALVFRYSSISSPDLIHYVSNIWFQNYSFTDNSAVNYSNAFRQNSVQYSNSLKLRLDAFGSAVPDPNVTPTPEPTATPEPTPSATPIPTPGNTVIIVTPAIPTPTPFLDVDIPSSPGGDLDGDTTDGILSTGFNFITNGGSSGLLSTAFSFIPDELQYLIWFLIFLLIILATLKIILHFGG